MSTWAASVHPAEAIVKRITGAANRADGIRHLAAIDRLAQAANMHIASTLVDIDDRSPDAVEQLLTQEDPARPLHQELEQPVFGWPKIDRASVEGYPLLFAGELNFTDADHSGY